MYDVEFVILGIGQDGGAPQIGNPDDPAWTDASLKLWAASGALIDHRSNARYLFEATPDMREQLHLLGRKSKDADAPLGLSGIFLTHAHIGHYSGLIYAGHESAGARELNVFALPRMQNFLENNGPWDQLVRFGNIKIMPVAPNVPTSLKGGLSVVAHLVPHRDEYSETVAYVIQGLSKSVLFLPDLDDWDRWETEYGTRIEDMIAQVDVAYVDATFFDDHELPGRDMSRIPHPRVTESIARFQKLALSEQEKVRFFHINHTNAIRFTDSAKYRFVYDQGFKVAKRGESICLD